MYATHIGFLEPLWTQEFQVIEEIIETSQKRRKYFQFSSPSFYLHPYKEMEATEAGLACIAEVESR